MNLRYRPDLSRYYDGLSLAAAIIAIYIAYRALQAGGFWRLVGFVFGFGAALIAYGMFAAPKRLVVSRYREKLVHKPETWLRLVFASDFHTGEFKRAEWYEKVVLEIQALDPDVIFLGGDYVEFEVESIGALESLKKLHAHLGKYFILGNHDYLDRPQDVRNFLSGLGFADLTNGHLTLKKEGRYLQISGLDDCWQGHPEIPPIRAAEHLPHITFTHDPDAVLDFSAGDTDLLVCGHTHGGQIRLPVLGSLLPIPTKLGRAADKGRKIVNAIPLIVSSGCGESEVRARLFNPAEIVVVELGI